MSEEIQDTQEESTIPSELETLQRRADMMGIKYHPNTGVDKLRAKIDNAIKSGSEGLDDPTPTSTDSAKPLTEREFRLARAKEAKKNAGKLVRVRVTCMNPNKKGWEGEIISVGSARLGTFKKYIPFDTEWHIPQIMLDVLKERRCTVFTTVKDHLGNKIRKARQVQEFNVEILPPLTKEELKELAQRQAMSGSIDKD